MLAGRFFEKSANLLTLRGKKKSWAQVVLHKIRRGFREHMPQKRARNLLQKEKKGHQLVEKGGASGSRKPA